MISLERRLSEYEKKLNKTLKGYEKQEEYKYKNHIDKINEIKDFGLKDYYALSRLTYVNYIGDMYKTMDETQYDMFTSKLGIEKKDYIYKQIKEEIDKDKVRNIIWKECLGMDYELLSREETELEKRNIQQDYSLTDEEKYEQIVKIYCQSGYNEKNYINPIYALELKKLKILMEEIRVKKDIIKK